MRRKKRIKLEEVVVEALRLLPRGMDVPSFTGWVAETIEQNKTLPRIKNGCEKNRNEAGIVKTLQSVATPDAAPD